MRLEKSRESQEAVPVALYIRTLAGDPGNSLEVQLMALQGYARRNRLAVARILIDIQGGRSQFEQMMLEALGEDPPFGRCWSTTRDCSAAVRQGCGSCGPGWRAMGSR